MEDSVFGLASELTHFNGIVSKTTSASREFSEEELFRTPVELNWYYVIDNSTETTSLKLDNMASARQARDIRILKDSLSSTTCDIKAMMAMVRLATMVQTASRSPVLAVDLPRVPVTPPPEPPMSDQPDRVEVAGRSMAGMLKPGVQDAGPSGAQPDFEPTDLLIQYSFMSAFLLRFGFRLPGDRWEDKMRDFQGKFSDMMGIPYNLPTPSVQWANSFNTMAKDLKHRFRIVIFMAIQTQIREHEFSPEAQKLFKYLFATPFAYYGMSALMQLRKCADSLDILVEQFVSALSVRELTSGIKTLSGIMLSVTPYVYWPFCRAFDDSFFTVMAKLEVKKVLFVCLTILNMKGGQIRPIAIDQVKALSSVKERETLTQVAAEVVTAIDYSRPDTETSKAINRLKARHPEFEAKARRYRDDARTASVMNQQVGSLSIDSILKK